MAIIDQQLMFSDAQDVTVTAVSTNYVDFGVARNLGSGERLMVLMQFGTVVSNATITPALQGADNSGFSTNLITIVQGKQITPVSNTYFLLPVGPHTAKQFVRMNYVLAGGSTPHVPISATFIRDAEMHFYLAGAAAMY